MPNEEKVLNETNTEIESPTVEGLLGEISNLKLNTVSKEEYNKLIEDNKKLIKEVTENRNAVNPEDNKPTRAGIITRCQERTNTLDEKDTLGKIQAVTANYRDMKELGLDTRGVEEEVVEVLEGLIQEANGDNSVFEGLLNSRIRKDKI